MQFVVKYFSEIVMKSKPVRRQFVRELEDNLRAVLCDIDPHNVQDARGYLDSGGTGTSAG
jgi:adenylyl- and sulfurtransferase ThiI